MEFLEGVISYGLPFLIVLTGLVFVHELGHYLVARWCGVSVSVFSIGFGREIVGWTDRSGTRWKVSWIPFGGYVKFLGDSGVSSAPDRELNLTEEQRATCFQFKPLPHRAAVVAAGPIANFLFAIIIFAAMFLYSGEPYTPALISYVEPESAAAEAGFQIDDRITVINDQPIERFEEIQRIVRIGLDLPLSVMVERGGEQVALTVQPKIVELTDRFGNVHRIGRLGIGVKGQEFVQHGPFTAIWRATEQTAFVTTATLKALGQMIVGTRPAGELRGPVGIVQMSGQAAQFGWIAIVQFMAFLSISLGLINLFPVPMLDGGHLLFYAFEAVRGKPLGERSQEYGFRIGLALVVMLMLFATWNDLVHLQVVSYVLDLFS
jgi:regulator of sigma E protease